MSNILYANLIGDLSGAESSLVSLMVGLDRTKFQPVLACSRRGVLTELAAEQGIPVRITPISRSSFPGSPLSLLGQLARLPPQVRSLLPLLREEEIDLVHVNNSTIGLPYTVAAKVVGVPVIWHIRDILATTQLRKKLLRIVFRYLPDRGIAVSDACAAQFDGDWNGKIQRIYNGIDADAFRSQAHRHIARQEFAIGPDTPLIGCVGQLITWKGQDVLLHAAAKVAEATPGAKFMIVGDELLGHEPFRTKLENLASELGLSHSVIFTGFRRDVASLMDAMDIFVHCSVQADPLPRVLLEAMSLSKPIIATGVGGIPELVDNGHSGILVPPRHIEALAQAIISLVAHRDEATRMGTAARERVSDFSIAKHVKQVTGLYEELLS